MSILFKCGDCDESLATDDHGPFCNNSECESNQEKESQAMDKDPSENDMSLSLLAGKLRIQFPRDINARELAEALREAASMMEALL